MIFMWRQTLSFDPPCDLKKILKNFIKHKLIVVEIYL